MNKKIELKDQCLCGEVKYKLSEKPLFTQACHCKDCKVLTGSSYVINSSILDNSKTFPPQAHIFTKDKDEWVNLSNINNCF